MACIIVDGSSKGDKAEEGQVATTRSASISFVLVLPLFVEVPASRHIRQCASSISDSQSQL